MPNDCGNILVIRGDEGRVQEFADAARGHDVDGNESPFSLASVLPPPSGLGGQIERWCNEHWGTPCDVAECRASEQADGVYEVDFRTPWSPPDLAVVALSERYPELEFTLHFDNSVKQRRGFVRYQAGELVDDEEFSEEDYGDWDED